ncbi:MAG: flagellar biosynthetic protein FlhB [Phycisphaerae bacterium]|jgi:flagellar biosynthetic protein FlhB|nr:MAG: flagellar biosynthetic protein FlhB [Phycisphaerae bacterium]
MADDYGDKTEAPTPRRRQEARENGQIARSQDLTAAVLFLAAMLLLNFFGSGIMTTLRDVMRRMLGHDALSDFSPPSLAEAFFQLLVRVAVALGPVLAGFVLVAIAINLVQVGFFLSTKRIQPKLEMLNPARGIKRIFGGGQGIVSLLMNLAKLVLITLVAYSAVHGKIGLIVAATQLSAEQIFSLGTQIVYDIGLRIAVLLLVLAILDYAYQRYKNEQQLKMTKQQVKEEMKRMEGDPLVKQRRRQIQLQRATQRIRQDVPKADFIVTNPTHYAVAIQYDPDRMNAPKVVAKGADYLAFRIREVAAEHGIPILERPPLARAIYRDVEVGQEIPEKFYAAVAEILAYVYEISGKRQPTLPV